MINIATGTICDTLKQRRAGCSTKKHPIAILNIILHDFFVFKVCL